MATVYVSPTGNDSRTYVQAQSSSTPWQTIGKCESSATTGDTIIVMAGTHTFASVTFTKSFTIQGQTASPSLYIFDGAAASVRWVTSTASCALVFENLTFQNAYNDSPFLPNSTGVSFTFTNCIINLSIALVGSVGALIQSFGTFTLTMTNCEIRGLATFSGTGSKYLLKETGTTTTATFTGCTIYTPALTAVFAKSGTLNVTFLNTITQASSSSPYGTVTSSTATYSCFNGITSPPTGTGVITSDPLFVDAPNSNFNLQPDSPCIGTGTV